MSDLTNKLLSLINQDKTINEISNELNLSNRQLYNIINMIRNKGIEFKRNYYDNGNIKYQQIHDLFYTTNQNINIASDINSKNIKFVVTSDLHIGNSMQRLDLLDKVYNYCKIKNIHIIFITGDLIDGTYSREPQIMNTEEQINFIIKKYPFDKNILNFVVLGDHDFSSLVNNGQNIATALNSYRHDIIPVGYQFGKIGIKRDSIILQHKFSDKMMNSYQSKLPIFCYGKHSIIFRGHFHHGFCIQKVNSNIVIDIPSLSDIHFKNESLPSVLLVELTFNNEVCSFIKINQLLVNNEILPINEIYLPFNSHAKDHLKNKSYKKTL